MSESKSIHVFKPKNDPARWCLSLYIGPGHRPIVCEHANGDKVRKVANDIQAFVDVVVSERERWKGACSACETAIAQVLGVDEPSSTDWVNLRVAMNLAAAAIRERGVADDVHTGPN